jgi:hypothetical protein
MTAVGLLVAGVERFDNLGGVGRMQDAGSGGQGTEQMTNDEARISN